MSNEFYFGGGSAIDVEERDERKAYPDHKFRACFYSMIGETPTLGPGDRVGARNYLNRIVAAIDHGGWSKTEWNRLYRLRDRWQSRADGLDARFEQVGNRQGGLTKQELSGVRGRASVTTAFNNINRLLATHARRVQR